MTPEEEKKAIEAMVEAGEIEMYSKEYYRLMGKIGGKIAWQDKTEEDRKERGAFLAMTRKLSTDE